LKVRARKAGHTIAKGYGFIVLDDYREVFYLPRKSLRMSL
jgi:hypothetical protein